MQHFLMLNLVLRKVTGSLYKVKSRPRNMNSGVAHTESLYCSEQCIFKFKVCTLNDNDLCKCVHITFKVQQTVFFHLFMIHLVPQLQCCI